jgi:hypothetical protein
MEAGDRPARALPFHLSPQKAREFSCVEWQFSTNSRL